MIRSSSASGFCVGSPILSFDRDEIGPISAQMSCSVTSVQVSLNAAPAASEPIAPEHVAVVTGEQRTVLDVERCHYAVALAPDFKPLSLIRAL